MKRIFAAVYVLVLATQLPHVYSAYAALESPDLPLAKATALGAALAFELSIGVFTVRLITGSRSKWTKPGLLFFLLASAVANASYYQLIYQIIPLYARWVMAAFATMALPLALALFAEEFGAEVKRAESKAQREQRRIEREQAAPVGFVCHVCGREFATQQGLNAHMRRHRQ